MPLPKISKPYNLTFGCDPEIFFTKKGKIIGSEKVLPPQGIKATGTGKIIRDGIQAELNPDYTSCRTILGTYISDHFDMLKEHLKTFPGVLVNFTQTVSITPREMNSLSAQSKELGCKPSSNIYDENAHVGVDDASKFLSRSAGGHIHLGGLSCSAQELVPILDIIVGNTCVLIDRSSGNKIRRKTYGRAGEYREHPRRVEYRTLSNFWLRNHALMSFVMGLSRIAVAIVEHPDKGIAQLIRSKVETKDIIRAINTNDANLALKNFRKIRPTLMKIVPTGPDWSLSTKNIRDFEFFVKKGINHWFKKDAMKEWLGKEYGDLVGWESFLSHVVRPVRLPPRIRIPLKLSA